MLAPRRLIPFLVLNGCRRYLSFTRLTLASRKLSDDAEVPDVDLMKARLKSRPLEERSTRADDLVTPRTQRVNRPNLSLRDDESDEGNRLSMLDQVLYPRRRNYLRKYIPLEAAAEIVMKLRSLPATHPTSPPMVSEVLKIAERADPRYKPWPLKAIQELALCIARPGETPVSDMNVDLIVRLLRIATGTPDGPYGQHDEPRVYLFGVVLDRATGAPILLTDYDKETRSEYATLASVSDPIHSSLIRSRMQALIRRENNSVKQDILVREYLKSMHSQMDGPFSAHAMYLLGLDYAVGHVVPRDGKKAKLWWERAVVEGFKALVLGASPRKLAHPAFQLARVYLGQQPAGYGKTPLFAPDFSQAFRYLHLAKWTNRDAAYLLGKLYYLDPHDAGSRRIQHHISAFGVIPDDPLAAEAFCIGAERLGYVTCKLRFAEMLYRKRAHPPADSSFVKSVVVPQHLPSSLGVVASASDWSDDDTGTGLDEELAKILSLYEPGPEIAFAPRSRSDTLAYAWQLIQPMPTGAVAARRLGHIRLAGWIFEEARNSGIELPIRQKPTPQLT